MTKEFKVVMHYRKIFPDEKHEITFNVSNPFPGQNINIHSEEAYSYGELDDAIKTAEQIFYTIIARTSTTIIDKVELWHDKRLIKSVEYTNIHSFVRSKS